MQHIYLEQQRNKANKPSSLHTTDSARTSRNKCVGTTSLGKRHIPQVNLRSREGDERLLWKYVFFSHAVRMPNSPVCTTEIIVLPVKLISLL